MQDGRVTIYVDNNADKASKDFNNLDKSLGKSEKQAKRTTAQTKALSGAMTALKTAVVAYLSVGLARGLNSAVDAFREQERAVKSLETAMRNSGTYTQEHSQNLQELASNLQKVSNFGDEVTLQAMAQAKAHLGNIKITKELTMAVADYAAATGTNLKTAFDLVGRSIGTGTNALSRYGIEIDSSASKQEKHAQVVEQLTQKYSGQAGEMADASVQLGNAMGDLSETIGGKLDKAFEDTASSMIQMIEGMQANIKENENLDTSIEQTKNLLGGLWNAFSDIWKIVSYPLTEALGGLKTLFEVLMVAIDGLVSLLSDLSRGLLGAYEAAKKLLTGDFGGIEGAFKGQFEEGSRTLQFFERLKAGYKEVGEAAEKAKTAIAPQKTSTSKDDNTEQSSENGNSLAPAPTPEDLGAYDQLNQKAQQLRQTILDTKAAGVVDMEQFNRLRDEYQLTQQKIQDINASLEENTGQSASKIQGIASQLSAAITTPFREGETAVQRFGNIALSTLQSIVQEMLTMFILKTVFGASTGGAGLALPFANGGVMQNGKVTPFASGGVVDQPTTFPMKNGTGLMGEAGPEAIMPLRRGKDGKLGVEATSPTVNIYNQSQSSIETVKRPNGEMDVFIRKVNTALNNERTNSSFSNAMQRQQEQGVQAV